MTVERESFDLVRTRAGDASVFTLGIGDRVNRYIIDGLARAGNGEAFVATGEADGAVAMRRLQAYIDAPLLTRLQISFSGAFQAEEMSREQAKKVRKVVDSPSSDRGISLHPLRDR